MNEQKNSSAAVWSLVLGILSLVLLGPLAAIPAIICGHLSRRDIRRSNGALAGGGMALAGLIMGYLAIVATIIWIAVFGVLADRTRSNLSGAVEELGGNRATKESAMESADWLKELDRDGPSRAEQSD